MEIQLVLPSERTAAPMDKTPARRVTQVIPMFDDPISSASEDESRIDGAAFKSEVVRVPRQNSMRLPETTTPVITISRTASTSTASTSRAGLLVQTQNVDDSRGRHRTQNSLRSTPYERIARSLSCRKQKWQCHLTASNQQR